MKTRDCPQCGEPVENIAARCPRCHRGFTHRDCYPEQYNHPAVGRHVEVVINGATKTTGAVTRVLPSRFGPLVFVGADEDTAWRLVDCVDLALEYP